MARDIRFRCDLCREDAAHIGVTVVVGEVGPGALDLCDAHYADLLGPVVEAVEAYGLVPHEVADHAPRQRVSEKWRHEGPFRCLEGCGAAPLKHRASFDQHLRRVHGITWREYVERHGELVPLTPAEAAEAVVFRCEVAGCDQVYSTELGHNRPERAMVSHMWGHHAIKWTPASAREASGGPGDVPTDPR